MPTISSMEIPIPKHWQDFESIVRDALAQRWNSTNLQKHGRPGQAQDGVDIWGPDEIGRPVGIQCKHYKSALKLEDVTGEIKKASNFSARLTTLFIATTADYDAKLQQQVRLLSDQRVAKGEFAVSLLFWDDIVGGLLLNPAVFRAHYPQIVLADSGSTDRERQIASFELGYYGADLWAYIGLIYGEAGWLAHSDPDEFIATLRILERRAQQVLSPEDTAPMLECLEEIRTGCQTRKKAKSDWDPVEDQAKRFQKRLQRVSSLLPLAESNLLDIGLQLGRIYHHSDDGPAKSVQASVESKVRSVLPKTSTAAIDGAFSAARKLESGYRWAMKIYNLIDHELRFRQA